MRSRPGCSTFARRRLLLLGAASVWTTALCAAETGRVPVVGVIRTFSRNDDPFERPFVEQMRVHGWEAGRNVELVFLWLERRNDRVSGFVAELVARRVDVIVVFGDPPIRTAQQATSVIPIVGMADDLLGSRLVASMARPGGNTTGVSILASELDVKRLELLRELVPRARRIGVLADPNTVSTRTQLETAARALGVELVVASVKDRDAIVPAIDSLAAQRVEAVNVLASPVLNNDSIIDVMRRVSLPAVYQWPETARQGGLLAYGPSLIGTYRQVAGLVDRILKGAKPADLPVEQPTKLELVINLKTARALRLTIPQSLLLRADAVIQ